MKPRVGDKIEFRIPKDHAKWHGVSDITKVGRVIETDYSDEVIKDFKVVPDDNSYKNITKDPTGGIWIHNSDVVRTINEMKHLKRFSDK